MKKTLSQLQNECLPRLDWQQIITVKEGGELEENDVKAMREYFAQFLPTGNCVMCGEPQTGNMMQQFMGVAKFTWGLVNGEGFCGNCKYPARAYHRDVGPIKFVNLVLQYHPDELENRSASNPKTLAGTTATN